MKINDTNGLSAEHSLYLQKMMPHDSVAKPKPVPEGMTKEEFILSLQSESAKQTLKRDPKDDVIWNYRPMTSMKDQEALAKLNGKTINELRYESDKKASVEEIIMIEGMRRKGYGNTKGQSEKKGYSDFKYEMAKQAFTCTPPATLTAEQKARLVELNPITEYTGPVPMDIKPKRIGFFEWLFGKGSKAELTQWSWRDLYKEKK